jgi:hypothetical protein
MAPNHQSHSETFRLLAWIQEHAVRCWSAVQFQSAFTRFASNRAEQSGPSLLLCLVDDVAEGGVPPVSVGAFECTKFRGYGSGGAADAQGRLSRSYESTTLAGPSLYFL